MCIVYRSAVSVDGRDKMGCSAFNNCYSFLKKVWVMFGEIWSGNKSWAEVFTRMSRQAALSRVIWSAMVSVVKPGNCLANSTVFMMHLVESSLNLSHRSTSKDTRRSELLVCRDGKRL